MGSLKVALLLSCLVTYTSCQNGLGPQFGLPTPKEQYEANSVNSFRNRQSGGNDNNNAGVSQSRFRPADSPQGTANFYNGNNYQARPSVPQQQPVVIRNPFYPTGLSANGFPLQSQTHVLNAPNPNYQQTVASRPPLFTTPIQSRPQSAQTVPRTRPPATQQAPLSYDPVTRFAWLLFKSSNPEGQNYVSCPLSPQLLLSYLVSASEGETRQELVRTVGFNDPQPLTGLVRNMLSSGENRDLQIATSFFVADGIRLKPNYKAFAEKNFVEIIPTNFYAPDGFTQEYNRWVRSKTKGAFRNVRVSAPTNAKMVMTSAVYFKGEWIFKFNPAGQGNFYSKPSVATPANMMTLRKKLQYGKLGDMAEWVSIPYNSSDSMIVILPTPGREVDDVVRNLPISSLFEALNDDTYANVNLTMPKFRIETANSLNEPLKRMGISRIFTPTSEITNLAENEQLQIASALQQASMEVNEEGSIAASLTSFSVVALSFTPPAPDVEMIVDRPFIAMIVDRKNNFPYFIAKVVAPQ